MEERRFLGQITTGRKEQKLDSIDRKILYLLYKNARYSETAIAKALRIKRETVGYRLRKMVENQTVAGFLTLIDPKRLGFRMHIMCIKLKNPGQNKDMVARIINIPSITRIDTVGGSYDLQLIITSKSLDELDRLIDDLMSQFHSYIQKYVIMEVLQERYTGLNFLLPRRQRDVLRINERKGSTFEAEFSAKRGSGLFKADALDIDILDLMSLDGRIAVSEISRKTGLSAPSVINRVKALVSADVINGFVAFSPLDVLGYQWYLVFFQTQGIEQRKFVAYMTENSNAAWFVKTIGKWNYQFSIFARNNEEFNSIMNRIRADFPDKIISCDSLMVFDQQKFVHRLC